MEPLIKIIKKDLKISAIAGFTAGVLSIPVFYNVLGVNLNFIIGVIAIVTITILAPLGYFIAFRLSKRWPVMLQFIKFGIVGGLNSFLDLGILNSLIYISGLASGLAYPVFKSVSFLI